MSPDRAEAGKWIRKLAACAPFKKQVATWTKSGICEFREVTKAAQPFYAAAAAVSMGAGKTTWVVCQDVREQEVIHEELEILLGSIVLFLPEDELPVVQGGERDAEIMAERLHVFQQIRTGVDGLIVVLTVQGLADVAPAIDGIADSEEFVRVGMTLDREEFAARLTKGGYSAVPQVSVRGEFSVRGGIIDLFSWNLPRPVRIELWGDEIESLREFDIDNQGSVKSMEGCLLVIQRQEGQLGAVSDYVKESDLQISVGVEAGAGVVINDELAMDGQGGLPAFEQDLTDWRVGERALEEAKQKSLRNFFHSCFLKKTNVIIAHYAESEIERFQELIRDNAAESKLTRHIYLPLRSGFSIPEIKVSFLSTAQLFGKRSNPTGSREARDFFQGKRNHLDFTELNEGDYVVHMEHGIGRYRGLDESVTEGGVEEEQLVVEFANESKLLMPVSHAYLLSRYVGLGKKTPVLSIMGDSKWSAAKRSAEKAVFDFAGRMLDVQARRQSGEGFAFQADHHWQRQFEGAFPYRETRDQVRAIAETKRDMEQQKPMDRLVCGDVGFGKTEVAIRAAFKAVMDGKQVAVLVPTTVLAQQHWQNFSARMAEYPIRVDLLSRYRSPSEIKGTVQGLGTGDVDIVIGTHRLLQKDITFKDLGLVVVDEEQRFGVLHKERLKERFPMVDLLTLSATPIPRTLYLALTGVKDMSTIETAPPNRHPVQTVVCGYDERVIRDAILREMKRGGQVFFLHNRIQTIFHMKERLASLCPKARIDIGHGQMEEGELEEVMKRFVDGQVDVLLATTIIESGLDIPNANTIFIDRADRFGLADLYQLRGRVGRGGHKAYAYLLLPRDMMLVAEAKKRIGAIRQYSDLGAGFRIAMRDLEIRGAGNILGTAQSGHISAVGFDLYCQLLKQAVAKCKGERVERRLDVSVHIDLMDTEESSHVAREGGGRIPAFIPRAFVGDTKMRIQGYRALAEVASPKDLAALAANWKDRFGKLPEPAKNLLVATEIKLAASRVGITQVDVRDQRVMLRRGGEYVHVNGRFPRLTAHGGTLMLREIAELVGGMSTKSIENRGTHR